MSGELTRRDLFRAGSRAAAVCSAGSLLDTLGADRIILGTDFPYESGELYQHAISYISDAGLKQADIARILDYNGAKVLGLA
jgi:predicted TIM-barrel fold metal-dependent hydrolase